MKLVFIVKFKRKKCVVSSRVSHIVTQKIHPLTGWKKENIPGMDKIRRFKKNTRKKEKNV